jgi:hypothetical protein
LGLCLLIFLCVLRVLGGISSIFSDATAKEEGRQEIPASHREEEDAPVISRKTKTQIVARCDKIKIERRVRVEAEELHNGRLKNSGSRGSRFPT